MRLARGCWKFYEGALSNHPIPTKLATAGLIAGAGDLVAQLLPLDEASRRKSLLERLACADWRRTATFAAFGAAYTGGAQHFLFAWLAKTFPVPIIPVSARAIQTAKNVALTNFVITPLVYVPAFFLSTEVLRGSTPEYAMERLTACWFPTVTTALAVWVPAQVRGRRTRSNVHGIPSCPITPQECAWPRARAADDAASSHRCHSSVPPKDTAKDTGNAVGPADDGIPPKPVHTELFKPRSNHTHPHTSYSLSYLLRRSSSRSFPSSNKSCTFRSWVSYGRPRYPFYPRMGATMRKMRTMRTIWI